MTANEMERHGEGRERGRRGGGGGNGREREANVYDEAILYAAYMSFAYW